MCRAGLGGRRAEWALGREILGRVISHPANRNHRIRAVIRAVSWQVIGRLWRRPVQVPFERYRLICHPGSSSASNVWYFTPRYDYHEMAFLDRLLRAGDSVLDVGANIGTYSLFCAARVGPVGRVIAWEPHPEAASRLRENLHLNGLESVVEVHESAVSHEAGTVLFHSGRDVANGIAVADDPRGPTIGVPAVVLDDVVAENPGLIFAKLDVEGAEVSALRGATKLLRAGTPAVWMVEVIPSQLRWFDVDVDDLYGLMNAAGFEPWHFGGASGELTPGRPPTKANVVFISTLRRDEVEARLAERPRAWV